MAVQAPPQQIDTAGGATLPVAGPVLPTSAPLPSLQLGALDRVQAVHGRRSVTVRTLVHGVLLLGAFLTMFPFYWMIVSAFKTNTEAIASPPTFIPHEWHPENFAIAWNAAPFGRYFANTLFVATCSVVGVLVVCSLAAFAFAWMNFRGKNFLFAAFLATMMIPSDVTLIPNFIIVTKWLGWYNTYQAQFITGIGSVFSIFLLRQFFLSIPKDLHEASMIDGCSEFRFFWGIALPLSVPALITVGLLHFLGAWNAFLWPLLVTGKPELRPIQLGLVVFSSDAGSRHAELMAASTLVILPTVLVFLVAQKYFVEGIARTGLKG